MMYNQFVRLALDAFFLFNFLGFQRVTGFLRVVSDGNGTLVGRLLRIEAVHEGEIIVVKIHHLHF